MFANLLVQPKRTVRANDIRAHFEKQSPRVGVSLGVGICVLMDIDLLVIGQFQRPKRFIVMLLAVMTRESD